MENVSESKKSAVNWELREYRAGGELDILRLHFEPQYQNFLSEIKSRPTNIAFAERVNELCMDESCEDLTAALCQSAARLNLELTEAEAHHLLAYCYRVVAAYTRWFGSNHLLEGFLSGYKIAGDLTEAVRTGNFQIEEQNGGDGEAILVFQDWVYGIYIRRYGFRGLSHLRAPGKNSVIYIFDGLNSDFVVTDLMSEIESEKLLDRLTN